MWTVCNDLQDIATGAVTKERFDAVFVCTGHHADNHVPKFLGLEDFQGQTIHSHDYKVGENCTHSKKLSWILKKNLVIWPNLLELC